MSTRKLSSKSLQSKPSTIITSVDTSQKSSTDSLRRVAIDQSGELSSLYDAKTDSLLGKSSMTITSKSRTLKTPILCELMKIDSLENKTLLHLFGISGELWLSLMLYIIPGEKLTALIDPEFPIDSNTRFLRYYHASEEVFIDEHKLVQENVSKSLSEISVTHLITSITLGIHAFIVLQLPDDGGTEYDDELEKIRENLSNNKFRLSMEQTLPLSRIVSTKIFSNISNLAKMTSLSEFCHKLSEIKRPSQYCSLEYSLRSLMWFDPNYPEEKAVYVQIEEATTKLIEEYIIDLTVDMKELTGSIDAERKRFPDEHFKHQLDDIHKKIQDIQKAYSDEIVRIRDLVSDIRSGKIQEGPKVKNFINESKQSLQNNINRVTKDLQTLINQAKPNSISTQDGAKRLRMDAASVQHDKDSKKSSQQVEKKDPSQEIQPSPATTTEGDLHKKTTSPIPSSRNVTSTSTPNFSSLSSLKAKTTSPSKDNTPLTSTDTPTLVSEVTSVSSSTDNPSQPSKTIPSIKEDGKSGNEIPSNLDDTSTMNFINILLLGESGVGKSTFVNAFVNYLKFEAFEMARSNKPVVLMPVSFLMTVGNNFEERMIKFGEADSNEDHDHPGQSVTQYCRSYIFQTDPKTKLRLIDTPGMGDTRGLDQDDLNMQHILSFINNLSHLNAICILLKPNEARLNIVLRSYFTRLLNFLGENARNNIVFCFTNTRATFYAPGNTGPLVRKMIDKLPTKDIPYGKSNTFCFDSESFRYLVALQGGIQFETYEENEYRQSWTKSATESNRLLKYISEKLQCYSQKEWQSMEHVQFKITQVVRPLLETIRNLFRNIILLNKESSKVIIELDLLVLSQPSAICYAHACKRVAQPYDVFWILPDDLHVAFDKCNKCACGSEKHIEVHHQLKYKLSSNTGNRLLDKMKADLEQLKRVILDFAEFYAPAVTMYKQNDSILPALMRMISEEKQILSEKGTKCLNSILYNELNNLKEEYEKKRNKSMSTHATVNLPVIYELIERTTEISDIEKHMVIIKQSQEKYVEQQEKPVSF